MSNRQVTYTLKLNSNISGILNQADKDAIHLDSSMWQLQKTLSAFGVGMGADYLINAAKAWTQGAADYEQAMLRIKNASDNAITGIRNGFFINKEVDDFKLKLDETIQAYGSFLFKIKNAHLSTGSKNSLFDDILTVSKAAGIPMGEMEGTVRNTAVMLGEGVLEARHLRGLSYTHPQLVPFIAQELGLKDNDLSLFNKLMHSKSAEERDLSKEQQLSQLISSGKLTKAALPAELIVEAYHKYANSVRDKVPETLGTLESDLNDLGNTWDRFKNKFVLDNKGELVGFFHDLTGGVHWLVEHQDQLLSIATNVTRVAMAYGAWRIGISLLQAPIGIMKFFSNEQERVNLLTERYLILLGKKTIEKEKELISTTQSTEVVKQETLAIEQENVAIQNTSTALENITIQMDLFTNAQLINEGASERFAVQMVELDGIMRQVAIGTAESIEQGNLFSETEMRKVTVIAEENEQLAIRNQLLAESAALGDANAMHAINTLETMKGNKGIINPYGGMLNAGSVSSLVSSVFIVGMAAELINGFLPKGNWSGNKAELSDWLYGASQIVTPYSWFTGMGRDKNVGFGKAMNTGMENGLIETFKDDFRKAFPSHFDLLTGKSSNPYVNPKGGEFWNLIQKIQKLHPEFDFVNSLGISPDNSGKMHTSNAELYATLQRHGVPVPYLGDERNWDSFFPFVSSEARDLSLKKDLSMDASKFGKDTHRIRGNSSNYFTININEMNGVKSFNVTTTGGDVSEEKVAQIAGDTMIKMLTDAINDAQHLRK